MDQTRLHIPLIFGYDVIHGDRTIFPIPLGLAASFDPALVEAAARTAATEARADGIDWVFSPWSTSRAMRAEAAGPEFAQHWGARGLALGDFSIDGRADVLIKNNGGAPLLLKNEAGGANHWLRVKLVGTVANIEAVGAVVSWTAGGVTRSRQNGGRRQLFVLARPAYGSRLWDRGEDRFAFRPVAAALGTGGNLQAAARRSLRHDR